MNYSYTNNSTAPVAYLNNIWLPGDTIETPYPVPDALGLTCTVEGTPPDPVLFHDDVTVAAGATVEVALPENSYSHNVALHIMDMSQDSGVECRFGSRNNTPIAIDIRGFRHVLDEIFCSKLFLTNPTQKSTVVSVSAVEVVS